ncbi:TPA: hypothetical protein RRT77_004528, partial [Klebsiella pneumoniae]|nr:hypothetical protein [Klebsiella pneumoniae]
MDCIEIKKFNDKNKLLGVRMAGVVNKFGLKRYIPSEIRKRIRIDAGYGCVICGGLFVDYEHIEPEFSKAVEHDPDKM